MPVASAASCRPTLDERAVAGRERGDAGVRGGEENGGREVYMNGRRRKLVVTLRPLGREGCGLAVRGAGKEGVVERGSQEGRELDESRVIYTSGMRRRV